MPEVDNLYLDMNGIIHNCTHGNDPGTKLTETQMIVKVFRVPGEADPDRAAPEAAVHGHRWCAAMQTSDNLHAWLHANPSLSLRVWPSCSARPVGMFGILNTCVSACGRSGTTCKDEPAAVAPLQGGKGADRGLLSAGMLQQL